jgi:hypothetical protein
MKKIFITAFMLSSWIFSTGDNATQDKIISKINEEGVFQSEIIAVVEDKTKFEIYKDVIQWASYDSSNIEYIIQHQVLNKKISLRGISKEKYKGIGKENKGLSFIIDIDVKDELLNFKLKNIRFIKDNSRNTSVCMESKLFDKNGEIISTKKVLELKFSIENAIVLIFDSLQKKLSIKKFATNIN